VTVVFGLVGAHPLRWNRLHGGWWSVMTVQYVVGDLSQLLAWLQSVATGEECAGQIATLRRDAESRPPWGLADIEARALVLAERLCWASLARGDGAAFECRARVASRLRVFGECSGGLPSADVAGTGPVLPDDRPTGRCRRS
jgi:hypothetical protein